MPDFPVTTTLAKLYPKVMGRPRKQLLTFDCNAQIFIGLIGHKQAGVKELFGMMVVEIIS